MSRHEPPVSIAIPAFNTRYLETALSSALAQDYGNIEVLVCDDSPGSDIHAICERFACERLRYVRNPSNLGFASNFAQCFMASRGEYVKLLNDDDVLLPECVTTMVSEFARRGRGVTLVTSKRQVIDEQGNPLPDAPPTAALTTVTQRINGIVLGDRVLSSMTNFIGEPTTVMFRRADVELEDGRLFRLFGRDYILWADVCLWLRLLSRGDAVYIAEPLSKFRVHPGQESRKKCHVFLNLKEPIHLLQAAVRLGFLSGEGQLHEAMTRRTDPIRWLLQHPEIGASAGIQPAEVEAERPALEAILRQSEWRVAPVDARAP
jgi:glycosyltransferase involved in cell wall biosynthesis